MKRSLNLMSERSRKRGQVRRCMRLWTRIAVAVLLLLTAAGVMQWHSSYLERMKRDSSESEYEPIRRMKLENARLQKQLTSLQEAERIPLELAKHQPLLGLVGLATQAVALQDERIYLQQIEIERVPLLLETTKQAKIRSTLSLAIEGFSVDSTAITRLADSLREKGPFTDVELSTNKTSRVGKQAKQAFAIRCTN